MRIETYRASHPTDGYGVTAAGTRVESLAGNDHLSPKSNRVFRHIFSVDGLATLEIREEFTISGEWHIKLRDIDHLSSSFGCVVCASVSPQRTADPHQQLYSYRYVLREARVPRAKKITSPLPSPIAYMDAGLKDLSESEEHIGSIVFEISNVADWRHDCAQVDSDFLALQQLLRESNKFQRWRKNVINYQRFGDFRDKCIHPGTNLIGDDPRLYSEQIPIRAYRGSLILIGRLFDDEMLVRKLHARPREPKVGVYSIFLAAFFLNIRVTRLGLDKVHSDYAGVPMQLQPGSRLETGAIPVVDSDRANQTLAEMAALYYQPHLGSLSGYIYTPISDVELEGTKIPA